ncbi:hypothetical protein V6N13_057190 [Hibiscus sabdariffa]
MQVFHLCLNLPPRALWRGCLLLMFWPGLIVGHYFVCQRLLLSSAPALLPWPGLAVGCLLVVHGSALLAFAAPATRSPPTPVVASDAANLQGPSAPSETADLV